MLVLLCGKVCFYPLALSVRLLYHLWLYHNLAFPQLKVALAISKHGTSIICFLFNSFLLLVAFCMCIYVSVFVCVIVCVCRYICIYVCMCAFCLCFFGSPPNTLKKYAFLGPYALYLNSTASLNKPYLYTRIPCTCTLW
jgi:hypothetical protein